MSSYADTSSILLDIQNEIIHARSCWGSDFDDKNTLNDWVIYSTQYATEATRMDIASAGVRPLLIKAAGLLVSAIERLDTNGHFPPRHYDPDVD